MKKTISWTLLLVLILAGGMPLASMADHRLTRDPYFLVSLSPTDTHTAYDPSKPLETLGEAIGFPNFGSSALLVQ